MIRRAFLHLARSTPRFAFSQIPNPDPPAKPAHESKPAQNKLPEQRQPSQLDNQDEPFEKQNRNTTGWFIYRLFFWGTFAALSYNLYLVHAHQSQKKKTPVEDESGAIPYIIDIAKSINNQYNSFIQFVTQPPSKKLLHDTVHPDLHPKTLVLNLTGTIIKTEYVFGKGQKLTIRPGLQKLLRRLSQKYEIVIFAEQDEPLIMGNIMKIDPRQLHIRAVLGRQSMVWKDGEFIKDLRYLNRDLKKIVAVDSHPNNLKIQPKNALIIPEFQGNQNDNQLQKVGFLLDKLAQVSDVRKFIEQLGENPVEAYYQIILKRKEQISKTAGVFRGLAPKNSKKEKPRPDEDEI